MKTKSPVLVPFSILGLVLVIGLGFVIWNSSRAIYIEHEGTVCCLSEAIFVSGRLKSATARKMMTIDLDDGRSVDVPIIDIQYISGRRILVREVQEKIGPHPRFFAVRYLGNERT